MLELVRAHGLEAVVARRLNSTYEAGRRPGAWVKPRVELAQEFVIGGYTPGPHGFDCGSCSRVRIELRRSIRGRRRPADRSSGSEIKRCYGQTMFMIHIFCGQRLRLHR